MVEQIANIVRAWPADRARNGQPYVALELICGASDTPGRGQEIEWSINVRCQPEAATALDGAISAAYPDVRLGRVHGEQPVSAGRPARAPLRDAVPEGASFVYPLIADGEREASAPLEQIARAQVSQETRPRSCASSSPRPRRSLRGARPPPVPPAREQARPPGALGAPRRRADDLNVQPRRDARRRTHPDPQPVLVETVVAADTREVCKAVAAAVQSRRGENRLHRRWMIIRQRLYRRRFPRALGPVIPSFRCLVSAAEVAHLLELPSARMKGVPVRRLTIPRIPGTAGARPGRPRPIRPRPRTHPNDDAQRRRPIAAAMRS